MRAVDRARISVSYLIAYLRSYHSYSAEIVIGYEKRRAQRRVLRKIRGVGIFGEVYVIVYIQLRNLHRRCLAMRRRIVQVTVHAISVLINNAYVHSVIAPQLNSYASVQRVCAFHEKSYAVSVNDSGIGRAG